MQKLRKEEKFKGTEELRTEFGEKFAMQNPAETIRFVRMH